MALVKESLYHECGLGPTSTIPVPKARLLPAASNALLKKNLEQELQPTTLLNI